MTVLLQDFLSGNLGSTLSIGAATGVTDSSFAALPAVTSPDTLKLVLDPDGTAGDPEIVTITDHTAASTTVNMTRGSEGTTARQHLSSTKWVNAVTTTDFNRIGFDGTITADLTGNADTATALAATKNFSLTGDVTAAAVAFDGSGNVELTTAMANDSVDLGTHTTGNYVATVAGGTNIDVSGSGSETAAVTVAHATMATPTPSSSHNNGVAITTVTLTNGHVTDYTTYDFDDRFLGLTAKAADSDKLDNLNSTQFLRSDTADTITAKFSIDNDGSVANDWSQWISGNHGNSATVSWSQATLVLDDAGNYPSLSWRSVNLGYAAVLRLSTAAANKLVLRNSIDSDWGDLQLGSLTQSSDLTLKTKTGDAPGLDLVSKLTPFKGYWNDGNHDEVHFWLGAQEVATALTAAGLDSDACTVVDSTEDLMGLQYTQFVPVLVKAVQELTARLEALEG
jgi:hypothetical protein